MTQKLGTGLLSVTFVLALLMGAFFVIPTGTISAAQDGDFTYTTSGDPVVATVTGYTGGGGAINVPATLGGYPTIAIGDYAFSDPHYPVTSVTIPDSVTSIGVFAFAYCISMTSVTMGNSVTTIGSHAFYECHALASMTIPDSVTSIELGAFYRCVLLSSVTIGGNVLTIGAGAFIECLSLTSIIIPDSVTSIGFMAFYRCNAMVQADIGNGVEIIGYMAFSNCTSLATVIIPDSTTSIGYRAFSDCPSLASITIGSRVTSIGYEAFRNCTGLTSITFRGLVGPFVGADWILNTPSGIRGHALTRSDFPRVGRAFNGLMMGAPLAPSTPDAPTGLSATPGNTEVALTWFAPSDGGSSSITSYHVYRSATEAGTYSLIASPTGLGYTDDGLTNGLIYWYNVSAVNSMGEGIRSAPISSTPFTVPDAPAGLIAIAGNAQASLNWTAPAFNGGKAIDYYIVYKDGAALPAHQTGLAIVITGLINGQSYTFTVASHNSAGNSTQSSPANIMPYTVPEAPTLVSAVPSTSNVILNWSANGNGSSPITGYKLYRAVNDNGTYTMIASLPELTYTDTSLIGSHVFLYKVSAVNAAGESVMSPAAMAVVPMPGDVIAIDNTMLILVVAVILIGAALVVALVLIRRVRK